MIFRGITIIIKILTHRYDIGTLNQQNKLIFLYFPLPLLPSNIKFNII